MHEELRSTLNLRIDVHTSETLPLIDESNRGLPHLGQADLQSYCNILAPLWGLRRHRMKSRWTNGLDARR